jgi:hypothetical protein
MNRSTTTLAWAVVVLTLGVITAVVLVTILAPDQEADVVGQLLAVIGPTVAVLVTLRALGSVQHDVSRVRDDTFRLTNGLLDAKVRAGVADVVKGEHLDPDYLSQAHPTDLAARDLYHDPNRQDQR